MTYTEAGNHRNTPVQRRQRSAKIEIAPVLYDALRELAAVEEINLALLVTLLIRRGLDRRGQR